MNKKIKSGTQHPALSEKHQAKNELLSHSYENGPHPNPDDIKRWQGHGATGTLIIYSGNAQWVLPLWKEIWQFLIKQNIFLSH